MKYEEYQVWFHTYNAAIASIFRNEKIHEIGTVCINIAKDAADVAVNKFKMVEDKPQSAGMASELKSVVEQVTKEAMKRGKI